MALSEPEMYGRNDNEEDYDSSLSISPLSPEKTPDLSRQAPSQYEHVSSINLSPTLQLAKAKYNMEASNVNYNKQYNDNIGIIMIRTTKGDELTMFGCCNIYIALYLMLFYHLFINIPYFYIGSVMFNTKLIGTDTINDAKLGIMTLYILFGILRFILFILGIYLIPKYKKQKLCELVSHSWYKYLTKIWLSLLLISPILCDLILVLGYIEDVVNNNNMNHKSQNDTIIMFVFIVFELLISIYFFFATNTFISLKWPNLRQ